MEAPDEIMSKYPKTTHLPPPVDETIIIHDAVFVADHSDGREYWKGFELVEWSDGTKELRAMYYTRKRGSKRWIYGEDTPIINFDKLKRLISMIEEKGWFK